MTLKLKRWIYVLGPVAALGLLIGWRLSMNRAVAAASLKQREMRMKAAPVVRVDVARPRAIEQTLSAIGTVESPFNVKIASKVAGRIDFLQVREGDHVTPGQVLVRIDPSEIEAQVHQQEAAVAEARSRLAQAELTQNPTNVSVTSQIQQQQANLDSANSDLNQAKKSFEASVSAAQAAVTDAKGRVSNAEAAMANANAAIANAKANVASAVSKYNRARSLFQGGYLSAQETEDRRTDVSVQEGGLQIALAQFEAAKAARASARAQQDEAEKQVALAKAKAQADIDAAVAKVASAKAALEYAESNTAQTPAYVQNLAALRATVAAAEAGLRNMKAQEANTVLTSSIDGVVTARYADPGGMATVGGAILAIQELRQVWVSAMIPEEATRKVHLDQAGEVKFDALPGRTFNGRVSQMNPAGDPTSRQFVVRLTLANPDYAIKPGMFARVAFVTERIDAPVTVAREAVQQNDRGASVTVIDDENRAGRRTVLHGASDANIYQIKEGVQPGEKVVTLSGMPLKDGQVVRIEAAVERGERASGRRDSAEAQGRRGAGEQGAAEGLSRSSTSTSTSTIRNTQRPNDLTTQRPSPEAAR